MLEHEVNKMRQLLTQSGFEVIIATISGEPVMSDSITIRPNLKLSDVKINEYSGFILPCMAPKDTNVTSTEKNFVKAASIEGKPIAAQTAAVLILAKAGVLNGKKFAFPNDDTANPNMCPEFKRGTYSGNGVIKDGNIITSGICPMEAKLTGAQDGTTALTQFLVQEMKAKAE